jgi:hypothetical protein
MQENIRSILPVIESKIFTIRGLPVMLDRDLANLYQVETKKLNQAVKRNINRFPEWFMFQLTYTEWENLRSQFVTSSNEEENALRSQIANLEEINIQQEKGSRSQFVTLNEKKNLKEDFLRSQIATSSNEKDNTSKFQIGSLKKTKRGTNLKYLPFAFTEQGVAMLSAVLKSETAVKVSIQIMTAFVALRKLHYQSASLYQRIEIVEKNKLKLIIISIKYFQH